MEANRISAFFFIGGGGVLEAVRRKMISQLHIFLISLDFIYYQIIFIVLLLKKRHFGDGCTSSAKRVWVSISE